MNRIPFSRPAAFACAFTVAVAAFASLLAACQPVAFGDRRPGSSTVAPPAVTDEGSGGANIFGTVSPANAGLAARAGSMVLTRVAFGSCAHQDKPQPLWDDVLAARPQLFLFAGDNVYGDQRNGRPVAEAQAIDSLTDAYRKAASIQGLKRLRESVPHLATWDDHDYGRNDAGADFAHKAQAQQLFADFWTLPADDPRRRREGVYSAQSFGPPGRRVQVILLDTRYFRSPLRRASDPASRVLGPFEPDPDPSKTVLGAAQWQWLREQLLQPADLRLIVSSIQVLAQGHQWERWGNFPAERQRLFELIAQTRAAGVVFLSGDRHIAALYRETTAVPYPLVEITASGITQYFPTNAEPGPNRIGEVYGQVNFGTIDVDWTARTVTLAVRAAGGAAVREQRVGIDTLRVGG